MKKLKVQCPHADCGRFYSVDRDRRGKTARCPNCQTRFVIQVHSRLPIVAVLAGCFAVAALISAFYLGKQTMDDASSSESDAAKAIAHASPPNSASERPPGPANRPQVVGAPAPAQDTSKGPSANLARSVAPPQAIPPTFTKAQAIALIERHRVAIVNKHYDGGLSVEATVLDHVHDGDTRRVQAELRWEGALSGIIALFEEGDGSARHYVARGWLKVSDTGWVWEEQFANNALKQYLVGREFAVGLANAAQQSASYKFIVTNSCAKTVKLAICYRDMNGTWQDAGWWTLAPGAVSTLLLGDKPVNTKSAEWYYFAESTDGRVVWQGDLARTVHGRTVKMRKQVDTSGDNDLRLTCD